MDQPITSFYKYFTINQNLFNSLINNELYFSNPRYFNDPFDSLPRYKLCSDIQKLEKFYLFIQKHINEKIDIIRNLKDFEKKKLDFESLLEVFLKVLFKFDESYYNEIGNYEYKLIEIFTFYNNPEYFKEAFKVNSIELQNKMYADYAFLYIDINKFGVACGSTTQTCPVMWGHYGNNHTGICLKFEFCDDTGNQSICLSKDEKLEIVAVDYNDSPLDIFNLDYDELENLILTIYKTKCSKWAYENEVRLINNSQGLLKINNKSIKQIIFGCKTTPKDRYSILKLISCLGYRIDDLMIAKIQADSYELKIERMTIEDLAGSGVYLEELNVKKPF
ncbi:hypothetical protein HYN59_14970 [Flavobacterium album]|uniref:DUF2971 domain-containing protein n=1 Tax=Flavobacterium album TaxID=2175091 RepID=A0A2S1R171_9FLAO|nr:DUF2971 domain-containing protein [Flavobacterium album]AWH86329.1 hypothetical protein HYN59_14970 [Flavobacterium album]